MDKKQLWAFYTPQSIIELLLNKINFWKPITNQSTLLEPSWWDGWFIKEVLKKYPINKDYIQVFDINKDTQQDIEKLSIKFQLWDTLLLDHKWVYSHIIWNPPYLNKQSNYIKENKKKLKNLYKEIWVHDTYTMFIYKCKDFLEKWWILGFVISDTFLSLGIHKAFRKWLLDNFSIKEIVLLPNNTFKNANVKTCLLIIENTKPTDESVIKITTEKGENIKLQSFFKDTPNNNFIIDELSERKTQLLSLLKRKEKLLDYLDGGLWMFTKNNNRFAFNISYDGVFYAKKRLTNNLSIEEVKNNPNYAFFHKQWWNYPYYNPVEYALKIDEESEKHYSFPSYFQDLQKSKRKGFIISGVCSFFNARLMADGAYWESNKAFWFFPKTDEWSVEYFLGLLNSKVYRELISLLNHTNSLQIRDIKELPMIKPKNKEQKIKIEELVKTIINKKQKNINIDITKEQQEIDIIVENMIL